MGIQYTGTETRARKHSIRRRRQRGEVSLQLTYQPLLLILLLTVPCLNQLLQQHCSAHSGRIYVPQRYEVGYEANRRSPLCSYCS